MFDVSFHAQTALHHFVEVHDEALQNASLLLGGQPALTRTQSVLDDIRNQPVLTRRIIRGIAALHDLLTLRHVGDPDRDESEYFARLDPALSQVEEICLLADGLADALAETVAGDAVRGGRL